MHRLEKKGMSVGNAKALVVYVVLLSKIPLIFKANTLCFTFRKRDYQSH